jgi:DNA uptake protein ComE-like DNA-binding protein
MKYNFEPIRSWFGFTRRERRASFILFLIIIVILIARYIVPEKNITVEDITASFSVLEGKYGFDKENQQSSSRTFFPVPDTVALHNRKKHLTGDKGSKTSIGYRITPGNDKQKSENDTVRKGSSVHRRRQMEPVDLNNCDSSQLIALPGIGPVLSVRIIRYRDLLGGYASVDQLKDVYGLPAETFDIIKERVFADSSVVTRIRINSAGYKELSRLPFFGKFEVTAILKYRDIAGRINSINDLIDNKLITLQKAKKARPYLNFE